MHRSGTSAVARVLNLCGASLGGELLPAKEDNERGFWENRAILALHERFLAEVGSSWHDLAPLPADWQQSRAARRFVAELPHVLDAEFGDNALIAVKDPRLCLLAPLWIEVLRARATRVACILTIRDPDEIAASLARRDGLPVVQSQAAWLQHLLDGERATRGHARVFAHYERLLADWRAELGRITAALRIDWPVVPADVDAEIAAFISPSLRHHRGSAGKAGAQQPELVRRAYALACDAASGSAVADTAFDAIAADFARTMQIAAPLYRELSSRRAVQEQQHAQQIEEARHALDVKDQQIERARANIDALAEQIAQARDAHAERDRLESELRAALDERAAEIDRARAALDERAAEIDRARAAFAIKEQEIDAARRNIDALASDIDTARATIALKDRELAAAAGNIDALVADLRSSAANLDRSNAQLAEIRAALSTRDAEVDAARTNIDALVAEIERARAAHAMRDATEAALRAEIAALRQSRWFRLGRAIGLLDRDRR